MAEKCPKCHRFTTAYDSYRKVKRCMVDGCSCIVIDKDNYSYLKRNLATGDMNRVNVNKGKETHIIQQYKGRIN